ncbi:MAG: hypothetical protein D6692_08645 [Planctomycetota bacterium]|nr:MAG: hypothetical protein D6692_08645 [Planctomycetota bacterium]
MRLILLMILLWACSPAFAVDYFVRVGGSNANSGTSADQAWGTVAYAFGRVSAGDTVYVGAGRYAGQIYVSGRSGRFDAPIRFVADRTGEYTGDAGDVVLENGSGLLHLSNCDYTELEGFVMEVSSGLAVYNDSSVGVVIDGCEVVSGGAGLHATNGGTFTVRGVSIIASAGHGIYLSGGSAEIEDSTIELMNNTYSPVHSGGRAGLTLRRSSLLGGGHVLYANGGTIVATDTVLASGTLNGIHAASQPSLTLVNCTIYGVGQDGLYANGGTYTIHNTIFSNPGRYAIFRASGSFTESHNLYHGWGEAMSYGFTPSGPITDDPAFTDAAGGDFTLSLGSPAIDAGMDASGYTSADLVGFARPSGDGWDIGAYEFDPSRGAPAPVPYSSDFGVLGAEWVGARLTNLSTGGTCLGSMGRVSGVNETVRLFLRTTPGTEYQVVYDLILFDGWDFSGQYEDDFRIRIGGAVVHRPMVSDSLSELSQNIGSASTRDRVYRARCFRFVASDTVTVIEFGAVNTGDFTEESWGIDNIRVMPSSLAYAAVPYEEDFEGTVGEEWTTDLVETQSELFGRFLGRFGVDNAHAAVLGVETVPGESYTLRFDIFFFDSWDSREEVRVMIDGQEVISNFLGNGFQRWPPTFLNTPASESGYIAFWANYADSVFRGVSYRFTATSSRTTISFHGTSNQRAADESWGLDSVSVRQGLMPRVVRWREISSVDPEE